MVRTTKKKDKMVKLDKIEQKIVKELIRNARASDSEISKKTSIPVMTVNRRRKKLEDEKVLRYYTSLDKGEFGMEIFGAKKLFIIQFKIGISRKEYIEKLESDAKWRLLNSKYISFAYLGDSGGHLSLIIALDAKDAEELIEEFNAKIVPYLRTKLGKDCIRRVSTTSLTKLLRVHHNYMPAHNMDKGRIKKDWPDDLIFVDGV
ncbi:Lrp/AsnC family transcriptional regulator [Candidatus Woesearchaeota archaeon]|jgi:DNA-binding Lrp family transcriptional regulator|nr:Lrp/AsnC family transcriptional regulator [Candidatus Woesearchaeota archaeon]MBT4368062.1 Lrp/AsnC family transcriptional regulator [Candidatus Woesearchaeota archaeon]MBT4712550.1 Lrp/AsnC family transcriptional regulator [Candidatus Woesearchaeota archaeon]MBT6639463.1 Lrp/AsnC family transcriptional regulator [Candidatus Woesearchaeota archaeon]MBT7133635.1 Lrp/AsnC family transcriptional regulator [Candidatus Woesearchaeota archaeon]